jgi:hypothetical protein
MVTCGIHTPSNFADVHEYAEVAQVTAVIPGIHERAYTGHKNIRRMKGRA